MLGREKPFVVHKGCLCCLKPEGSCKRKELYFQDLRDGRCETLPYFICSDGGAGAWWLQDRIWSKLPPFMKILFTLQRQPPLAGRGLDYEIK